MARDPDPDWRPARVVENRPAGRASRWLVLEATDDEPAAYAPGHVLGLGLMHEGKRLRHAYTVSRGWPDQRRSAHLYRVIPDGRMTPVLDQLEPGDPIDFHGPFHDPIAEEIDDDATSIMGIATGVGIGPLLGYAADALAAGETRPITLLTGVREAADRCELDQLEALADEYDHFSYHYSLSQPDEDWSGLKGRVTTTAPGLIRDAGLDNLHVHLVGNGAMVRLFRKALREAGMNRQRVTIETYFNHDQAPEPEAVEPLVAALEG